MVSCQSFLSTSCSNFFSSTQNDGETDRNWKLRLLKAAHLQMSSHIYEDPDLTIKFKYGHRDDGEERLEREVDIYETSDVYTDQKVRSTRRGGKNHVLWLRIRRQCEIEKCSINVVKRAKLLGYTETLFMRESSVWADHILYETLAFSFKTNQSAKLSTRLPASRDMAVTLWKVSGKCLK